MILNDRADIILLQVPLAKSICLSEPRFIILKQEGLRVRGCSLRMNGRGWRLCFPLQLHARGSDLGLYDGSDLETWLFVGWWGPDALAVCWAHRGLPVGFLLLQYSVLLLSPYLCFISLLYLDLYVLGDDALIS